MPIDQFVGHYRFLSNFYPSPITINGITYQTVEHAYQAAKTIILEEKQQIADSPSPTIAKRRGRKVKLRPDWEKIKVPIMEYLVRLKFITHQDLRQKLLDTGDTELIEGNTWNDRFWGVCQGKGRNELGKILMRIRGKLNEIS